MVEGAVAMKLSLLTSALAYLLTFPQTAHTSSPPHRSPSISWNLTPTSSTQQFRGLSPVSENIVWVSGTNGTVLLTTNRGRTWNDVSPTFAPPENSSSFEFRDIHAWSARSAAILSIGNGNASRIYVTHNAGRAWSATFVNEEETAFYDCMAFEKERPSHGVAMSDPVDGKFRLIETGNGGLTWDIVDTSKMPAALDGEFGFAASGTCVEAAAGRWYIATGGVDPGRVFRSTGVRAAGNWEVSDSNISGSAAAGVFSVRFRDRMNGIAVGGDFQVPDGNVDNAAWSKDGGATWVKAESFPGGYRSGVSWVPSRRNVAIAVGISGSDVTLDSGRNWRQFDDGTFDAVECVSRDMCWASGAGGRVAWLSLDQK